MTRELHPEAEREFYDAVLWYGGQRIMHNKRRPGYWRDRIMGADA